MLQNKLALALCAGFLLTIGSQTFSMNEDAPHEQLALAQEQPQPTTTWSQSASLIWNRCKDTVSRVADIGLGTGILFQGKKAIKYYAKATTLQTPLNLTHQKIILCSHQSGAEIARFFGYKALSNVGICSGVLLAKESYDSERTLKEQNKVFFASCALIGASLAYRLYFGLAAAPEQRK